MSQIKMAEMQLIGFGHGSTGYSITALADSMGLKKSEWEKLRDKVPLKTVDKQALDEKYDL